MAWMYFIVLELFSLEKSKLSSFLFCQIFFFNEKESQSCQFSLIDEKLYSSKRHKQELLHFLFFNVIIR